LIIILGIVMSPGFARKAHSALLSMREREFVLAGQSIGARARRISIGDQIIKPILLHQKVGKTHARQMATEMLDLVGIPSPAKRVDEYPHPLSARVFRLPAHRHRTRAGAQPSADRVRRARLGPGRVHPDPGHQSSAARRNLLC
jgi:hypothetical protein